LLYLFLYAPIAILVLYSFNSSTFGATWEGFTLRWYAELLGDKRLLQAFANSLTVAGASTVIATILGTAAVLALERYRFPGRRPYEALLYLPIVSPEIVMAVALLAFFAFGLDALNGWLGTQLRLGLATVTIAHVLFNFSFVVVLVRASLSGLDPRLEEAAQHLGASPLQTFRHITLPLIMPGILGGALLTFTLSLDNFILSFFTTGPGGVLLPVEVYSRIKRTVTPTINAASTVMLALSTLLVLASHLVQRRGAQR
jgi:spermidine/putrescine transport system permease protein